VPDGPRVDRCADSILGHRGNGRVAEAAFPICPRVTLRFVRPAGQAPGQRVVVDAGLAAARFVPPPPLPCRGQHARRREAHPRKPACHAPCRWQLAASRPLHAVPASTPRCPGASPAGRTHSVPHGDNRPRYAVPLGNAASATRPWALRRASCTPPCPARPPSPAAAPWCHSCNGNAGRHCPCASASRQTASGG